MRFTYCYLFATYLILILLLISCTYSLLIIMYLLFSLLHYYLLILITTIPIWYLSCTYEVYFFATYLLLIATYKLYLFTTYHVHIIFIVTLLLIDTYLLLIATYLLLIYYLMLLMVYFVGTFDGLFHKYQLSRKLIHYLFGTYDKICISSE